MPNWMGIGWLNLNQNRPVQTKRRVQKKKVKKKKESPRSASCRGSRRLRRAASSHRRRLRLLSARHRPRLPFDRRLSRLPSARRRTTAREETSRTFEISLFMDSLPAPSHLSPSALSFLDGKFHTKDALSEASTLVAELQTQCSELDRSLNESTRRLGAGLSAYTSLSGDVNGRLSALASTCSSNAVPGSVH
ncbi:hypothetical protein Ahy_B03g068832 isoform C [Arachis hypogaea]|uniref:Uncharacterized protein n=1 Tax=Arachis hypogaea TaxID=3818 RepID=A0A445AB61_ARAHY|nr:hypothetical protein Ahy_B03g068832 isoform C [Arachis hypogaea]